MSQSEHFCCPDSLTQFRGELKGEYGDSQNGIMVIIHRKLKIIFANGEGWEHVSVSTPIRTPTWEEMEWVRLQFWPDGSTVMQLHVPISDHINTHNNCLHLWRPTDGKIPRPPQDFV